MSSTPRKKDNIVWIDLEMTGLYPDQDEIIEAACIITDKHLNVVAESEDLIIHQDESRFKKMDDWNQKQHTKSGLWKQVMASKLSCADAEATLLKFIKAHTERGAYLAGNSIWQDRRFIRRYMPNLDQYLHYRMIDVTSIKIVCNHWHPKVNFRKQENHRALDDIKESIAELRHYKEQIMAPQ